MRFHPHTEQDRKEMLAKIGAASIDDLYSMVPKDCAQGTDLNLPKGKTEAECEEIFRKYAKKNHPANYGPFFLGAGSYFHHVPATVDYIIQRSEFLTAYTPYQPEVSQGTLQVVFEYQSMIAALTGQEISNASLYDGATAVAEAALMARRVKKRDNVAIRHKLHPHYQEVVETYFKHLGGEVTTETNEKTAAIIVQYPDFYGEVHNLDELKKEAEEAGAMLIVVVNEIISLGLLPAPSQADIVCGEAQSIGNALMYGGPHLGFLACSKAHVRQLPGRLCGVTEDSKGQRSFVLTLNTREQHIRRDKATSNICTNQGLCATAFTTHLSLLGENGFKKLALLNHERAQKLAESLGDKVINKTFFNEFLIQQPNAKQTIEELAKEGIIAGLAVEDDKLLVCATENTSDEDIKTLTEKLEEYDAGSVANRNIA